MRPEAAQSEWEFQQLLRILDDAPPPTRILEVGVYEGGTLWEWIDRCDFVVAVDEAMRNEQAYRDHANERRTSLHLILGDSHDPKLIARVDELGPFDFIFIDADHTYEGVSGDWANYRPMLAPGGLVAFHDIAERPSYGVTQLWNEIKVGAPTIEIVESAKPFWCGIGVIWP